MTRARWRTVAVTAAVVAVELGAAPPPAETPRSTVFVQFDRPSAGEEYRQRVDEGRDAARTAARAAREAIDAFTDELLAEVRGAEGAGELFRTANAVPGVALRAHPQAVRELAARPGVRAVRRIRPARWENSGAVQLGRAVQAWQQTGRLGTGVRIGVVDSGIDYTHADFGGAGTPEAYRALDPARVDPTVFPTAKVVGGIDLAGDDYDADDPAANVPRPDPNPLDCAGHGTHVAGTAAGYGVTADGATFRGDHTALTPAELDGMRIGPGAAPGASLYAIRVFGCSGSTALTVQALDHALDPDGDGDFADRLDVVNLSLGSAFGAVDDPVNDFVRVLTDHGVLVVAAAGNAGDRFGAGGPPGNSPDALAVASVRDAHVRFDGVEVLAPAAAAAALAGQYSVDYERYDDLDVTAGVVELGGTNAQGCEPYSAADAARVRGAIVWLAWPDLDSERACGSAPRAAHAAAAGAVGALLTSGLADFGSGIAGNAEIPVVQLTGASTAALRPALAAGLRVRIAGSLRGSREALLPQLVDTPSTFTSRGVHAPTVKPDVAGPGESITSARSGSGSGREQQSGTSMAAPFVAGVAALVLDQHPGFSPAQVKAAIMGTASGDVHAGEGGTGPQLSPMRTGAGRVDARAALAASLLAANAAEPGAVSVTFGSVPVPPGESLRMRRQVRVTNAGPVPVVVDAAYEPITSMPGVRFQVTPARVVVAPDAPAVVDVTLRVDDPAALRRTMDPTLEPEQAGRPRQYLADASGRLVLTPADGSGRLRVPVSAAPEPVSELSAERVGDTVALHGTGVDQGSGPQAYRSRVGLFALAAGSPELPVCSRPQDVAGCVVNDTGRGGDLRHVGVASTAGAARAAGRPADALLAFAVTTWRDLPHVGTATQPSVEIDTDGDDRPEFTTTLTALPGSDVLVARTVDRRAEPEQEVDVQPVNGADGDVDTDVFDTDTWVLPVRLAALGVDPAARSAPLRFRVVVLGDYGPPAADGVVDSLPAAVPFDPLATGLDARPAGAAPDPSVLLHPAGDGTVLHGAGGEPVLVLMARNGPGARSVVLDGNRHDDESAFGG